MIVYFTILFEVTSNIQLLRISFNLFRLFFMFFLSPNHSHSYRFLCFNFYYFLAVLSCKWTNEEDGVANQLLKMEAEGMFLVEP